MQTCEAKYCRREVFSACHICQKLLCYEHFQIYGNSCETHSTTRRNKSKHLNKHKGSSSVTSTGPKPEDFQVEGERRENDCPKKLRTNKQKLAKTRRDLGQEYVSPKTGAVVAARQLRQRCNSERCSKLRRQCALVDEEQRLKIFKSFNELGNLTRQRDFIVRHVKIIETRQKTSKNKK